jgi:hypothetical protein
MALVRTVMRLPIRQIRELLRTLHGGEVSIGAIVEVLHRIRNPAQPVLNDLKATIRASPAVHADDTGWREDGLHGSLWSVSTPTVRYGEDHHSRAGDVATQGIGEQFQGCREATSPQGTIHQGVHHRCRVHSLRESHTRKEQFPEDEEVLRWTKAVKDVDDRAVAWAAPEPGLGVSPRQLMQRRVVQPHAFEPQRWTICQPSVGTTAPQQVLCPRVADF